MALPAPQQAYNLYQRFWFGVEHVCRTDRDDYRAGRAQLRPVSSTSGQNVPDSFGLYKK